MQWHDDWTVTTTRREDNDDAKSAKNKKMRFDTQLMWHAKN